MSNILIAAQNIRKSFNDGDLSVDVLKGIEFSIQKNQSIAIIGASGSGKSTLLHLLAGLDVPDSGNIFINKKSINELNNEERGQLRNECLGFIYQFHHLLPEFSAIENILMPTWINGVDDRRDRALELIEKMGLSERKDHFPGQLSGGERSRVAVVRALMNKPKLVLADEPTGNLDEKNANKLIDLLGKINKDFHQAIVLTTHNPKIARIGHKQFFLENGSLSEKE